MPTRNKGPFACSCLLISLTRLMHVLRQRLVPIRSSPCRRASPRAGWGKMRGKCYGRRRHQFGNIFVLSSNWPLLHLVPAPPELTRGRERKCFPVVPVKFAKSSLAGRQCASARALPPLFHMAHVFCGKKTVGQGVDGGEKGLVPVNHFHD